MPDDEKEFHEVSKTLNITLPFGNIPLPLKVISLLTSVGGLSILASILADIVRPQDASLYFHLLRILTGAVMLAVGYGIIKNQEWSLWLYGVISAIALVVNSVLALLPICITFYLYGLYKEKSYFTTGTPKAVFAKLSRFFTASFPAVK